jgi:hypothetical protein
MAGMIIGFFLCLYGGSIFDRGRKVVGAVIFCIGMLLGALCIMGPFVPWGLL